MFAALRFPMHLADFDYALPEAHIAQFPPVERGGSRLLCLPAPAAGVSAAGGSAGDRPPSAAPVTNGAAEEERQEGRVQDRQFGDLPDLLRAGDLLILNDTRVLRARLHGHKASGGAIELLIERITGLYTALAQIRASKPPRIGSTLHFEGGHMRTAQFAASPESMPRMQIVGSAEVLARAEGFYLLRFTDPVAALLEARGALPLPPYIHHTPEAEDEVRYQTVYAASPGAVAAPTAGLHFTPALLTALRARGVAQATLTLHVGAGTFQPIREEDPRRHTMHAERYTIPAATQAAMAAARRAGGRIVAVGTTTLRALESHALAMGQIDGPQGRMRTRLPDTPESAEPEPVFQDFHGETRLFITPGFAFQQTDLLLSNFHLPRSTLLMLVCAFAGQERVLAAYRHAVAADYRFFSYGDAMLLERTCPHPFPPARE